MTELALPPLVAVSLLVELTEDGFGVDAEGDFLNLHGLEELGDFAAGVLSGLLFLLARELFGFFALLVGGFR